MQYTSHSSQPQSFVNDSINMSSQEKIERYELVIKQLSSIISKEDNIFIRMVAINAVLKSNLSYFYWVGFYIKNDNKLSIGPYQGTLGCTDINFDKGVCGAAYRNQKTMVVPNVHEFPSHIACDSKSQSEIVVPVFDDQDQVIAVFDVDSTQLNSFDSIDRQYLEGLLKKYFSIPDLKLSYSMYKS